MIDHKFDSEKSSSIVNRVSPNGPDGSCKFIPNPGLEDGPKSYQDLYDLLMLAIGENKELKNTILNMLNESKAHNV